MPNKSPHDAGYRFNSDESYADRLVQALVEGRWDSMRTRLPAPQREAAPAPAKGESVLNRSYHYDSQGYCDNPGRGY